MRTVRDVAIFEVLPDRAPADIDRLADSLTKVNDAPRVILNMSGIDLVSSLFLARVLELHKRIQRREGELVLCCLHPQVQDILVSTRLDTLFEIAEDEEAALASL